MAEPPYRQERRQFLTAALGLATSPLAVRTRERIHASRYRAAAFDAFAVFDPGSVSILAEGLFPGRGSDLMNIWRARQFEYSWLRLLSDRYADFGKLTEEALVFAANANRLELTDDKRRQLVLAHSTLKTWPDAISALTFIKAGGIQPVLLSNFSREMLEGCIKASGIGRLFDHVLSTDAAKTYKPDPRAYRLAIDALKQPPERVAYVAFAGWDAAGAEAFGYPTFWANRLGLPPEELGIYPEVSGRDLSALPDFLGL
jgi:2-haloacid dehalogenase